MIARALMDTNVIAYRFDGSEPRKQAQASALRRYLLLTGSGFLSTQVVCEFYNVLTRLLAVPLSRPIAARYVAQECEAWTVLGVTPDIALGAIDIAARHQLSIWDAQLVATALDYEIPYIVSEDFEHGRDYGGVRTISPFAEGFTPDQLGLSG